MRLLICCSFLIVLAAQLACDHKSSSSEEQETTLIFHGDHGEPCFEIQLEVWMMRFQQLQQMGYDMYSADEKAREASTKAYLDCRDSNDGEFAVQARKE